MDVINANSKKKNHKITSRMPTYKIQHVVTENYFARAKIWQQNIPYQNYFSGAESCRPAQLSQFILSSGALFWISKARRV